MKRWHTSLSEHDAQGHTVFVPSAVGLSWDMPQQKPVHPFVMLLSVVASLSAFAYLSDDLVRMFGFFALPFGALAALFGSIWLARLVTR